MIGELVRESEIFDTLYSEDLQIIVTAKNVLKESPINGFLAGDNVDRIWFDKNIKSQEQLLQLKTRVDSIHNQFIIDLYQLEGECLRSGEYEFIKSRDERVSTMIATEPDLRDKKISIDKLKVISSYVDGLLWSLRDLMKLFKK